MTESIEEHQTDNPSIFEEVLNSITHGLGVLLAIGGMVLLIGKAHTPLESTAYIIYSLSLMMLFLFSTLRHALHFTGASTVFRILDHSGIYILIAGTYTPYCLIPLNGWIGWTVVIIVWICAIAGIVFTAILLRGGRKSKLSTLLFVAMGWVIALALWPLYQAIPHSSFWLLVAGGLIYSLGALFYHFKFPYAHVWWHIFVLAAAFAMWLSIYWM